jgi:hypothetical protein
MNVNSDKSLEEAIELLRQSYAEYKYLDLDIKVKGKARSGQQRKALEVYCCEMSRRLRESGQTYTGFLQHVSSCGVDVDWNQENFKDAFRMYGVFMYPEKAITKKDGTKTIKTSKLTKIEISDLYELVNERMSILFTVGMNWPSGD